MEFQFLWVLVQTLMPVLVQELVLALPPQVAELAEPGAARRQLAWAFPQMV